jgi:hypothetical protein
VDVDEQPQHRVAHNLTLVEPTAIGLANLRAGPGWAPLQSVATCCTALEICHQLGARSTRLHPRGARHLRPSLRGHLAPLRCFVFNGALLAYRRRCPQSQGAPERSSPAASSRPYAVRVAAQTRHGRYAIWCQFRAACLHAACCMLHVACCTLHAARCMLHAVRTVALRTTVRTAPLCAQTREQRRSHASSPLGLDHSIARRLTCMPAHAERRGRHILSAACCPSSAACCMLPVA